METGEGNTESERFFVSKRALGLVQNVLRSIDEESNDDGPVPLESICFDGDRYILCVDFSTAML